MRILALLSFYDEPCGQLAATVSSLKGLADGVLAVDGAYMLFPDALRRPNSGAEQTDVIFSTARALGMDITIHQRPEPWHGNEVEKRQFMFDLGETLTTEDDWYLLIDADEQVSQCPFGTREELASPQNRMYFVAECIMWEHPEDRTLPDGTVIGYLGRHTIRRFWRALRGIEVGPAHHQFHAGDVWLSDANMPSVLAPALTLHDVLLEHRNVFRSDERLRRKTRYYALRDSLGIERSADD